MVEVSEPQRRYKKHANHVKKWGSIQPYILICNSGSSGQKYVIEAVNQSVDEIVNVKVKDVIPENAVELVVYLREVLY